MRLRGYTMIELATALTISAVLVPAIYLWWRSAERGLYGALAQTESAQSARTVSEELRRDLFTLRWRDAETLVLVGSCGEVRYEVERDVLWRRAQEGCGGTRALARNVASAARTPHGVELTFARWTGAHRYAVSLLFAGGEAP